MIYDKLGRSSTERYGVLHPLFTKALDYVMLRFEELLDPETDGRHTLIGDDLFVIVGDNPHKSESEAKLEVHNQYVDIQVVLAGVERFGWRSRESCLRPQGEFDPERDILFYDDRPSGLVTVNAGEFVIFFPEDAHAPLIAPPDSGQPGSRKAIVKVRL